MLEGCGGRPPLLRHYRSARNCSSYLLRMKGTGEWGQHDRVPVFRLPFTTGRSRVLARRRTVLHFSRVSLGLAIGGLAAGLTFIPPANAGAAGTIKSSKAYAQAQLLKLSNLPSGWTKSGGTWVGSSGDNDASSMLTMTQYPDFSTCLGEAPALSVVATEASSSRIRQQGPEHERCLTSRMCTAARTMRKPIFLRWIIPNSPNCFLRVQGPSIVNLEQSCMAIRRHVWNADRLHFPSAEVRKSVGTY